MSVGGPVAPARVFFPLRAYDLDISRSCREDGEMKRGTKRTMSLLVLMSVLLAMDAAVFAGPTLPVLSDVSDDAVHWYKAATFTVNQSSGIWPSSYWSSPPVYTYIVNSLDRDITPAPSVDGILISISAGSGSDGTDFFGGDAGAGKDAARPVVFSGATHMYLGPAVEFTGGSYKIVTSGAN